MALDTSLLPDRQEVAPGINVSLLPDRADAAPTPEPESKPNWLQRAFLRSQKLDQAEIDAQEEAHKVAQRYISVLPDAPAWAIMGMPESEVMAELEKDPSKRPEAIKILDAGERTWATRYDPGKSRWEQIVERAHPHMKERVEETAESEFWRSLSTTLAAAGGRAGTDPMTYISAYTVQKAIPLALKALPFKTQAYFASRPLAIFTKAGRGEVAQAASLMRVGHAVPEVLAGRMKISTATKKMNLTETSQFYALLARELRVKANLPKGSKGFTGWMRRMLSPYKGKLGPE